MSFLFGGQLSTDKIQFSVHFKLLYYVLAGIKSSVLCHVDTSIYCCLCMLHLIINKTKTAISAMTENKMLNCSLKTK